MCVTEVECLGGGTTVMTCNLCTYYTLHCVCVVTSGRTQGTAAEVDTIGEQQAEADASGEQQLKWMQLGSSSWNGCNQGTVWFDHARLVLARDTIAPRY